MEKHHMWNCILYSIAISNYFRTLVWNVILERDLLLETRWKIEKLTSNARFYLAIIMNEWAPVSNI